MCLYNIPYLVFSFFLVMSRCVPVYLESISIRSHCGVEMVVAEWIPSFALVQLVAPLLYHACEPLT